MVIDRESGMEARTDAPSDSVATQSFASTPIAANDFVDPLWTHCRATLRNALARVSRQPFRVVPFFDPGPWGGQWMRRKFALPDGPKNYAWCYVCVLAVQIRFRQDS